MKSLDVYSFLNLEWCRLYASPTNRNSMHVFTTITKYFRPYFSSFNQYPFIIVNHPTFIFDTNVNALKLYSLQPYIKVCNSRIFLVHQKLYFTRDKQHIQRVNPKVLLKMINLLLWGISAMAGNKFGLFMAEWNYVMSLEDRLVNPYQIQLNVSNFLWHNVPYQTFSHLAVFHRPSNYYLYSFANRVPVSNWNQRRLLNVIRYHKWHQYIQYQNEIVERSNER